MFVPSDSAVSLEVGSQILHNAVIRASDHELATLKRSRKAQATCSSPRYFKTAWTLMEKARPKRVLDVGCGEGCFWQGLAEQGPLPEVLGLDKDREALNTARELHPELSFAHCDLLDYDDHGQSFDLVVATEVLEYQEQPERFLEKICRHTRGSVLLSVPLAKWFRIGNFLAGRDLLRLGRPADHLQQWNVDTFQRFVHPFMDVLHLETVAARIVLLGRSREIEYEALQGDELFVEGCRQ